MFLNFLEKLVQLFTATTKSTERALENPKTNIKYKGEASAELDKNYTAEFVPPKILKKFKFSACLPLQIKITATPQISVDLDF